MSRRKETIPHQHLPKKKKLINLNRRLNINGVNAIYHRGKMMYISMSSFRQEGKGKRERRGESGVGG